MYVFEIAPDRLVVIHELAPDGYPEMLDDAVMRRGQGWRLLSIDSAVVGFTGSAGNLLFNTGGGGATEVRYTLLYEKVIDAPGTSG